MKRNHHQTQSKGDCSTKSTKQPRQHSNAGETVDIQKILDLKKFAEDQTYVAMTSAKQVMDTEGEEKNVVLSPLSIHLILGVVAAGSTGHTLKEVLDYLRSKSSEEFNLWLSKIVTALFADASSIGGPHLSCANAVWVDKRFTLKPRFRDIIDCAYNTVMDQVDFQDKNQVGEAVKKVNQWAKEETNGLIKEVLSASSVDALTRLIFVNAVYFKGAWVNEFCPYYTCDKKFFLSNGRSVQAPFMTMDSRCWEHYACAFDGFKVLGLPYKQGKDKRQFSMYIFLPDSKDGLPALVEEVTSEPGFIEHHLPYKRVELKEYYVPKFKICFQFDASKVLNELGLVSPFSGGLTEMVDENLSVTSILHKSFVEVNERGTEAAAFTLCMTGGGGPGAEYYNKLMSFVADHPFLFIIREDTTGMLLFIGQVLNPLLE